MPFRLAHISDSHIGPLPRPLKRELIGKRFTGYVNWGRRKGIHDMEVLGRIVADMRAHEPDHIAMTGDILNIALPAEFPLARAWMQSLGSPHDVSFTPGNHDAYVGKLSPTLPDAYAAYYFFCAPQNGPGEGPWNTVIPKSEEGTKFRRLAGEAYPALDFYSFDYGPAHITVLSNASTGKADDPKVAEWVAQDLKATKQPWKFVCFHAPPFQVTTSH